MSTGVEDVEGCLDFCEDFEFFGVLDALDKALMCFCYSSEAEYQLYGESDICIDGLGGEDDGMCAMDVYEITCAMDKHVGCWTADEDGAEASTVWMSEGVEDIDGCHDFCADEFEFYGVLDVLDKALMCFCYKSEAEYQQYGESDICVDGLGGEDDGKCAMDVYEITCAMDEHVGCWTADEDGAEASTVWMSEGVEDINGCHDFCADDFEFYGVLDVLDKALMCFCYNSEAEYQQYGESDICVDGVGGEDDGKC